MIRLARQVQDRVRVLRGTRRRRWKLRVLTSLPKGLSAIAPRALWLGVLASAAIWFNPPPAAAATIERIDENAMGCVLRVVGAIEAGDAERLKGVLDAIAQRFNPTPLGERICLNSPGGSLVEAVRMGEVVFRADFGTAIESGSVCESACAIVFMAGRFSHPEADGNFVPDRVLHPRGRLGFHAPALLVEDRDFTKNEVNRAYEIALASVGEIVRLRAETGYQLADSLFLEVLSTPSRDMTYVATVGQAARWRIDVAPVALPTGDITESITNACNNADAGLLDTPPVSYKNFGSPQDSGIVFSQDDRVVSAVTAGGYRLEATASCAMYLFQAESAVNRLGYLTIEGGSTNEDTRVEVYAYLFHPADRKLSDLPLASDDGGFAAFAESFTSGRGSRSDTPSFRSCFLQGAQPRVVNVQNFVNLRGTPGFDTQILREVPLGERLALVDPNRFFTVGDQSLRQDCIAVCRSLAGNPTGHGLRDIANRCVNDNVIWYRVRDRFGTLGFVSRKFLDEGG